MKRTYCMLAAALLSLIITSLNETSSQTRRKSVPRPTATYACPLHPEVTAGTPRTCPKCGMKLAIVKTEKKTVTTDQNANKPNSAAEYQGSSLSFIVPDVEVYDQNGKQLKFNTDLIKGKTVAINFIFTTCTAICPPLTATFRRVQVEAGPNVNLISISVDPVTDTPERLKAYADKFKAGPGWTFVTGNKADIDKLLAAFGTAVANKNDHTPMILIGNDSANYWTRAYGLSPATQLVAMIKAAAARKVAQQ